jgi:hypothetical protein
VDVAVTPIGQWNTLPLAATLSIEPGAYQLGVHSQDTVAFRITPLNFGL